MFAKVVALKGKYFYQNTTHFKNGSENLMDKFWGIIIGNKRERINQSCI